MNHPSLKSELLISTVPDGYTVYDIENNRLHQLNAASALLLELCNGEHSVTEITQLATQVIAEITQAVVAAWVVEAETLGLLVDANDADAVSARKMSAEELALHSTQLREDGLIQAAFICREHAAAQLPGDSDQLRELGELAHILGKREAARDAYERYLELVPTDAEVQHLLTSLRGEQPPERVPDECIQQLYQRFATFYESNMCGELGYEGPSHLSAVIDTALGDRDELAVLDLGCGTGLGGLAIQHRAKRLVGIDLPPEMLEHADSRAVYDELHVDEVTQWLSDSRSEFDLIIACDTFIYFGDLGPLLRLAAARLSENGWVAFSVERAESGSYLLTDNGRYVHHLSHITNAAHQAGLTICAQRHDFIRMEYGMPVNASYICMANSAITADGGKAEQSENIQNRESEPDSSAPVV